MELGVFWFILLVCTVVQSRPQYNYPSPQQHQQPSGSYGAPSGGGSFAGGGGSSSHFSSTGGGGSSFSSGTSGGGGGGYTGGGYATGGGGDYSSQSHGGSSGGGGGGGGGGGVLIQKHIYVHVAPPEPEEFRPQRPIQQAQATKHYKIIFIKAPSPPAATSPSFPAFARNEEKTIVYVLVKKPDEAPEINIPTAEPTQPSKPEVYFIRYKTQTQSTGGGAAVHQQQSTGGGGDVSSISTGGGGSSSKPHSSYGPPGQSGPY